MTRLSAAWLAIALLALPLCASAPDRLAPPENADGMRMIPILLGELEQMPTLYARHEPPVLGHRWPDYERDRLTALGVGGPESFANERERRRRNPDAYERDFPLRAAVFAAVEAADEPHRIAVLRVLLEKDVTPKKKPGFKEKQAPAGMAIFNLEPILKQMLAATEHREKESNKRWLAHFDWAQVRLYADLMFLYEYNYTWGRIRWEDLPELGVGEDGWQIAPQTKLCVTEVKPKNYAKHRTTLLRKMREDYAGTPWGHLAEIEIQREVGLAWEPKKK